MLDRHPQLSARIAGVMYLLIIAAGLFAQTVRTQIIVPGNASATAANIVDQAGLYRIAMAADLSTFVCAIGLTVILFALLKGTSNTAALMMLGFNFVQDAVGGVNILNTYRPLQLLGGAQYLQVFSREQLEAMAWLSIGTYSVGFNVAMMFFGCSCLALGYLTYRSGFLPRTLGVMVGVAGVCYLTLSTAQLLSPRVTAMLFPAILVPVLIGELSFAMWLTVKGVKPTGWQEPAVGPTVSS